MLLSELGSRPEGYVTTRRRELKPLSVWLSPRHHCVTPADSSAWSADVNDVLYGVKTRGVWGYWFWVCELSDVRCPLSGSGMYKGE
jgi:hypothetical protein